MRTCAARRCGQPFEVRDTELGGEEWRDLRGTGQPRVALLAAQIEHDRLRDGDLDQRTRFVLVFEAAQQGEPVFFQLQRFAVGRGRAFELRFTFIAAGQQQFPSFSVATQAQTGLSAVATFAAAAQNFASQLSALLTTPPLVGELERTAQPITQRATNLVSMVPTLSGNYGCYVGQYTASVRNPSTTLAQLSGQAAQARESTHHDGAALVAAPSVADPAGMSAAAQTLVAAVQGANPDPHQAVQSLLGLQRNTVMQTRANAALTAANTVSGALYRRSAVIALASSTASYALASYDNARTLSSTGCDALDTEIVLAADAGNDTTFRALVAL
ncbi:hypothetical protein [Paraburkholderia adhaesiva]|uniref:hypothetical protein n=1 Tax=Paraburkholderia adhaesiva TaxID=2883244 RepID=UPI001F30D35A|nr:hypothetical protein [Paraburkholderia adhaesiva]